MNTPITMSLRDWFASMAMQGLLASDVNTHWDADEIADLAYKQADEMIKERHRDRSNGQM